MVVTRGGSRLSTMAVSTLPRALITSLGCTLASLAARALLNPWLGSNLPLVTIFGAIAAAEWLSGRAAAVTVALLGPIGILFVLPPVDGWALAPIGGWPGLAAHLFTSALIVGFGQLARTAQQREHDRRETLRVTLRSIGDAVITTDVDGRVTSMNTVAEALTRWTEAEAIGRPLHEVFHIVNEGTRQPVESPAVKALREGTIVGLANHTVLRRRDGTECPIDDSAAPIRNATGAVTGCVLTFRDVTAQRETEHDRQRQLEVARVAASIIASSDDAIIRKSLDGTIESWNPGAERLFGYRAADAIGRHISLVIPADRLQEEDQIIATLRAGKRIDHFETERMRSDGTRRIVSLTISPITDESGRVIGASKIARDVTEQRRAEQHERQRLAEAVASHATFVNVIENSQDFIGMCDLRGVPFFVNRAGLAMVGLDSLDDARRVPVADFFFPEDQPRMMQEFFPRVLRDGQGEIEVRFRHFKTGAARWMAYKVLTLTDPTGAAVGFATVSQDVTERKTLEVDLRRLADSLSEADRRKNEFLAMLAHELRNPLAPITNAVRAIRLRQPNDDETVRVASEMLERQVTQMSRLVDDLLDISRITRGTIELRRAPIELAPVIAQAVDTVRPLCQRLQHTLTISLPPEPVVVDGDAGRLAQAFGNLLNNACKFTDRGGTIALTVARGDGDAVITVRDNGIGLASEHLGHVFEMFAQVDTSLERSRDGLGIGLTLVRTLVELHGGTIAVRSDGPGTGCEFTIRLPALAGAADRPVPEQTVPVARPRRVLVVDDNQDAAESLAMLLEFDGHEVSQAHDGAEAIAAAERLRPDIVLMDIGLPIVNGYDACRRIRSETWGQQMVLVALTGWGQEEDREQSRMAGFDRHLVKPVDHDELLALVASAAVEAS